MTEIVRKRPEASLSRPRVQQRVVSGARTSRVLCELLKVQQEALERQDIWDAVIFFDASGEPVYALGTTQQALRYEWSGSTHAWLHRGSGPKYGLPAWASLGEVGLAAAAGNPVAVYDFADLRDVAGAMPAASTCSAQGAWSNEGASLLAGLDVEFYLRGRDVTREELNSLTVIQQFAASLRVLRSEGGGLAADTRAGDGVLPRCVELPRRQVVASFEAGLDVALGIKPVRRTADGARLKRPHLVQDFITTGLAVMVGPSEAGKSTLAASLAAAVATGTSWAGRAVPVAGDVLVLAGEDAEGFQTRYDEALAAVEGQTTRRTFVREVNLSLYGETAKDGLGKIARAIQHVRPRLLILDTFASFTPGMAENESSGMTTVLAELRKLLSINPDMTLLLLHHPPKNGIGMRGHGSMHAAVDIALSVAAKGDHATVSLTKKRNIATPRPVRFHMQVEDGQRRAVYVDGTEVAPPASDTLGLALQLIRQQPEPVTAQLLEDQLGLGKTRVHQTLTELVATRQITRLKAGRAYVYTATAP